MENFAFDLVNPERQLLSKPVTMAVIPGVDGDFGVLKGHAPVITAIRPGVVRIYDGETITQRFVVSGGFVEVTDERCTVLATEAFDVAKMEDKALETRVENAKDALSEAKDETNRIVLESRLQLAEKMLEAVTIDKAL